MGDVIGDIIQPPRPDRGHGARGSAQVISAKVPLSEMFGYATDLRSLTQGRANYSMQFSRLRAGAEERQGEEIVAKAAG